MSTFELYNNNAEGIFFRAYSESKFDGFFVEAGAYDGFTNSNTFYFEYKYNWTGE